MLILQIVRKTVIFLQDVRQSAFVTRFHWIVLAAMAWLSVFPIELYAETLAPGANLVQLTTNGKSRIWRASPRGEWLAYLKDISNTQAQLCVIRVDGSEDRTVSAVGIPFPRRIHMMPWPVEGEVEAGTGTETGMETETGITMEVEKADRMCDQD